MPPASLASASGAQLLAAARREVERAALIAESWEQPVAVPDIDVISDVAIELDRRFRRRPFNRLMALLNKVDIPPPLWLEEAREVAASVRKTTRGGHHLYVLLKSGFTSGGGCGLYVGRSHYPPLTRYWQHRLGYNTARGAHRFRGPVASLFSHLNPLSEAEANELEPFLAEALRQVRFQGRRIKVHQH